MTPVYSLQMSFGFREAQCSAIHLSGDHSVDLNGIKTGKVMEFFHEVQSTLNAFAEEIKCQAHFMTCCEIKA